MTKVNAITLLSAGEDVFVLRFAGQTIMVEFAFLSILAPLKVATARAFRLPRILTRLGA